MPTNRSLKAIEKYKRGEKVIYRDEKGRITTEKTFIENLKSSKITYGPYTTNNRLSPTRFAEVHKIYTTKITKGTYTIEKIRINTTGKIIYLKYNHIRYRRKILEDMINNEDESPEVDRQALREGNYSLEGMSFAHEYRDLSNFLDYDYQMNADKTITKRR